MQGMAAKDKSRVGFIGCSSGLRAHRVPFAIDLHSVRIHNRAAALEHVTPGFLQHTHVHAVQAIELLALLGKEEHPVLGDVVRHVPPARRNYLPLEPLPPRQWIQKSFRDEA